MNITVVRNENSPIFDLTNYAVTVQDTINIGTVVIVVTATDQDGVREESRVEGYKEKAREMEEEKERDR